MSNVHAETKPSVCELCEEELDHVSGGGTKGATSGGTHSSGKPVPFLEITLHDVIVSG